LPAPLAAGAGWAATFVWICLAWIFFRAQSFADAAVLVRAFAWLPGAGPLELPGAWLVLVAVLGAVHWLGAQGGAVETAVERLPDWSFAAGYGTAVAVAVLFLPLRSAPFIYFQF
jgi:alginate O-acetyltransferase complex protein AlgI